MGFEQNIGREDAYAEVSADVCPYVAEQFDYAGVDETTAVDVSSEESLYAGLDTGIINEQVAEASEQIVIAPEAVEITADEALAVAVNRLEEIDKTATPALYEAIYVAVSKLSDRDADGFYEAVDREVAELDRETTDFERLEANYRVLRRCGSRVPVMETDEARQLIAEATELRHQADSLAIDVYIHARDELIRTADWRAVIEHTVQKGDFACGRLAKLLGSFNKHSSQAMRNGFKNTLRWTSSLENWQEKFVRDGHMLETGYTEQLVPDDWQPNAQLMTETYNWHQTVNEVRALISDKRAAYLRPALLKNADLNTFETFFFGVGMQTTNPDRDGIPRPAAYALEQYVADRINAVYKADQEYRNRPGIDQPRLVLWPYQDQLRTLLGVDRPEDFFRDTLKRFPPSLIRHMGTIVCENSLEPIYYPDGRVAPTAASMNSTDNTMRLNMSPDVLASMIDVDKGLAPSIANNIIHNVLRRDRQAINRASLKKILDHETAHHIVQETGPLEWLVRMHQTNEREKIDVSQYVADSRTRGQRAGQHEDYAESGMLYMNNPWTLHQTAVGRFTAYGTLIDRYKEDDLFSSEALVMDDSADERLNQDRFLTEKADERAKYGAMFRR